MLQKYQHLLPAAPLLFAGVETLRHGPHGLELALAIFEIATSALLIGSVVREIHAARRPADPHAPHHAHGVDWFHIFAAGVLIAEAAERWHLSHHWPRPVLLTAVVTLGLGLFHGRIEAGIRSRRALRLSEDELYFSTRPWARFRARWADVTAIDVEPRAVTIHTRQRRTGRLDLGDLENAAAVRAALSDARNRLKQGTSTAE